MSADVDREQLRRDLSDTLEAIQRDDVTGLDVLAARLQETELPPLPFHGRLILKELAPVPRNYSALIWHLVQVIAKLEQVGTRTARASGSGPSPRRSGSA